MKCQHCLVQEANFHYRSNINGEIREQHLCADCAQAAEGALFAGALAGPMEAFEGLFRNSIFGSHAPFAPLRRGPEIARGHIPLETPRPQRTRVPSEAEESLRQRRILNALRQEMERAVEAEHFERAAELRDEISRLEQ